MANQPRQGRAGARRSGRASSRGKAAPRRKKVEMVALAQTTHCGARDRGRARKGLRSLFRVSFVALLLAAPIVMATIALATTTNLDPAPDSPYWAANAPQARGDPLHSGHKDVPFLAGDPGVRWRSGGHEPFLAGAVMDQENAYIVDRKGVVTALNLTTGEAAWTLDLAEDVSATPALAYGWLYVATEAKNLHAISARTGTAIYEKVLAGAAKAPPLVAEGRVFQGTEAGIFQVLDATTLDELWRFDTATTALSGGTVNTTDTTLRKPIRAAPAAFDGRVYVAAWNHRVYSFSTTGNIHGNPSTWYWTQTLEDVVNAPLAVDRHHKHLLVATAHGTLRAMDIADGTQEWQVVAGESFTGGAAVTKKHVVAATTDGRLFAANASLGTFEWERFDSSGFIAAPTVARDAIIALTANGTLTLRDLDNGTVLSLSGGTSATWRMPAGTHATPAVTARGALLVDQNGTATLVGKPPSVQSDVVASDIRFTGALLADIGLDLSISVTNHGPDNAPGITATLTVDNKTTSTESLGALGVGARHTWTPNTTALGEGTHTFAVTFKPVGSVDLDPTTATSTTSLTLGKTAPPPVDDNTTNENVTTPPPPMNSGAGPATFADGMATIASPWILIVVLGAVSGGVYLARRYGSVITKRIASLRQTAQ